MNNANCIVTGATRGIGHAIVSRLRTSGYRITGLARHSPQDERLFDDFIICDLTIPRDVESACEYIAKLDDIWALVNNAGAASGQSLDELTAEEMVRILQANTVAPSMLAKHCVPRMSDGGRILNICSVGLLGAVNRSAYAASKAALASLTRTWALELAQRRITVNAVAPGPIETELFKSFNPPGSEGERNYLAQIPLGHFGSPEDLAALAEMILSPAMSYLTGQVLFFDGGLSVGRTTS